MIFLRLKKFYLFIFILLIQSCSGGRVGNFLESSFKNIESENLEKCECESDRNLNFKTNNLVNKKSLLPKDISNINKTNPKNTKTISSQNPTDKTLAANKDLLVETSSILQNRIENKIISNDIKEKTQSYRFTLILKKIDPTSPGEKLTNILRKSNLNFEIEKIEKLINKDNRYDQKKL